MSRRNDASPGGRGAGPPGETRREEGVYQGRPVARRAVSPDGLVVLVGRSAADNDVLSLKLSRPRDFWFHVAGEPGSHVLVLNPDGLERPPKDTQTFAAGLAAGYSRARKGGRVAVHVTFAGEVSKPRELREPGKVQLRRYRTVQASPIRLDGE